MITNPEGRKSMLKLAERMVMSFCTGVGASTALAWTPLSTPGSDDVRVMTRKSMDDPGRPPGIVLSAATSFWLPDSPKRLFDFLRDHNSRSKVYKLDFSNFFIYLKLSTICLYVCLKEILCAQIKQTNCPLPVCMYVSKKVCVYK